MAYAKLDQSLSFHFHVLTAPGLVIEDYGPRVPGTLVLPDERDEKGNYKIKQLNTYVLSSAFHTEKEAFAHLTAIQDGSITLDPSELKYTQMDMQDIKCRAFRAEFFPIHFEPSDQESLKFHGAWDLLDYEIHEGAEDPIKRILSDQFPKIEKPSLPKHETEDGCPPVFHEYGYLTLSPEDWDQLRAYNIKDDLKGFWETLKAKSSSLSTTFAYAAEIIGRELLLNEKSKAGIIVEARFFSYRETYPPRIIPEKQVQKANLRTELLAILETKAEYIDRINRTNPSYRDRVAKAINFIATQLS